MRLRGVGNVPVQQLCPDNHRGLIRQHLAGGAASAALLTILSGASQGENLSNEGTEENVMLTSPATCHTWYATAAPATGRLQPAVSALPAPFPQLSPSARQHPTTDGLGRPQRGTVQGLPQAAHATSLPRLDVACSGKDSLSHPPPLGSIPRLPARLATEMVL